MIDRASELRAIADGRLMLNVRNGVTVSRSMLAMIADEIDALRAAPLAPAEVGGHADAQTEARAIAQTSLWVPAKPEHAKIGWTYDFEQTERIARAAYDSTGYDAVMEVVEFVMAEADRRRATALAAKNAELATVKEKYQREMDLECERANRAEELAEKYKWQVRDTCARAERAEAQLAEARKSLAEKDAALEPFAREADELTDGVPDSAVYCLVDFPSLGETDFTVGDLRTARRALEEQGGE